MIYFSAQVLSIYRFQVVSANEEQCLACERSSPYINAYIQFSNEIISTLQKYANKESSIRTSRSNDFEDSSTSTEYDGSDFVRIGAAIADNLNRKRQEVASTSYAAWLIASESIVNTVALAWVLTSSEALHRDWNKLEDVSKKTLITLNDLWNAWVFVRLWFKEWRKESIQETFKKYSAGSTPLFIYHENNKASAQPMSLLWDNWLRTLNQTLKLSLYWNGLSSSDALTKKYMWWAVSISPEFKEELANYYTCARSVRGIQTCSPTKQQTKDTYWGIVDDFWDKSKEAIDTFTTARKRLSWFRSKNAETKQIYEDRKYELLRWQKWRRAADWWVIKQLGNLWSSAKDAVISTYNNTKSDIEWIWNSFVSFIKWTARPLPIRIDDPQIVAQANKERITLLDVWRDTATEAKRAWKETVYIDVSPTTKVVPQLSQTIYTQKSMIDGKDNKNAIDKLLWEACTNQCRNVNGKKCYYVDDNVNQ